jgi:hypothetical protein
VDDPAAARAGCETSGFAWGIAGPGAGRKVSDLRTGQRTAEVGHGPAALEDFGRILVNIVQQKHAAAQSREKRVHLCTIELCAGARRGALQPVKEASLVALGLETADEPGSRVRESLVIKVDWILRCQHDAQAECPSLFEQGEQRRFRRWIGDGREIPEDLVHVEHRPQARRARLHANPPEDLIQEKRYEKHALGFAQMSNRENGDARLTLRGVQNPIDVEGLAFQPGFEAGRGEQVVNLHGKRKAIFRRIEGFEIEHSHLGERRRLDLLDHPGEVQILAVSPGAIENRRQQNVFTALYGIVNRNAGEREETAGRGGDAIAHGVAIVEKGIRRSGERLQHRNRTPGIAGWSVYGKLSGGTQPANAVTVLVPFAQARAPLGRLFLGELFGGQTPVTSLVRVHPGSEVGGSQIGKREHQVCQIAFGIDQNRRNSIDGRFFDQSNAQACLAASGHAHAHRVGEHVLGVVEH